MFVDLFLVEDVYVWKRDWGSDDYYGYGIEFVGFVLFGVF